MGAGHKSFRLAEARRSRTHDGQARASARKRASRKNREPTEPYTGTQGMEVFYNSHAFDENRRNPPPRWW